MQPSKNQKRIHEPVLVDEVIKALGIKEKAHLNHQARCRHRLPKQKLFIDATIGTAGHSIEIVKRNGRVLGIDADEKMLKIVLERLKIACPTPHQSGEKCLKLVQGNFKDIFKLAENSQFTKVDGIIFDLGISNVHLRDDNRGFSFIDESKLLDMRLDIRSQKVTAADLLNSLRVDQLVEMFAKVLSKRQAQILAKKIVLKRKEEKIETVGDLLEIIGKIKSYKLHPATKPFLALRMAVNSELENLKKALPSAFELLKPKGRLAVISFHSGEDRIVKNFFRSIQKKDKAEILTKKPQVPTKKEILKNPKARSAKLRVLQKI